MINNANLICIGKISKPHGVLGEVKVISYTQNPADIFSFDKLVDKEGNEYSLTKRGMSGEQFIGIISGIKNRTEVEKLSGTFLYVPREMLKKALNDEFYYEDLKSCTLVDSQNEEFGLVKDIHNFGAGDILEVNLKNGKIEYLPFNKDFILRVDLEKKIIVYNSEELGIK